MKHSFYGITRDGMNKAQFDHGYWSAVELKTKLFIVSEAKKIKPDLTQKPGVRYRLNAG